MTLEGSVRFTSVTVTEATPCRLPVMVKAWVISREVTKPVELRAPLTWVITGPHDALREMAAEFRKRRFSCANSLENLIEAVERIRRLSARWA